MTWLRLLRFCVLALALVATAGPWPSSARALERARGLTWNRDHAATSAGAPEAPPSTLECRPMAARFPVPSFADPRPEAPAVAHERRVESARGVILVPYATTVPPPRLS